MSQDKEVLQIPISLPLLAKMDALIDEGLFDDRTELIIHSLRNYLESQDRVVAIRHKMELGKE